MSPLWDGLREGCGTCWFAGPASSSGASPQHECRLHPPVVMTIKASVDYDSVEQHRPWMPESGWCGQYKRSGG